MTQPLRRVRRRYSSTEAVANELRERILSGQVADGEMLPKIDDLADEFSVSRAAIRQASLVLESEGLLSVVRGNIGGSIVHLPTADHVAYTLGLVLQARNVGLTDVRGAISRFEPHCAELCAERPDRATTVVPMLRQSNEAYAAAMKDGDGLLLVRIARQWHEVLVTQCGNETMQTTVGMLSTVWSSHLRATAAETARRGTLLSADDSKQVLDEHEALTDLIAAGDAPAAGDAARAHFAHARVHPLRGDELDATVRASVVRDAQGETPVARRE